LPAFINAFVPNGRLRPRLMHEGASLTLLDAITRHRGEASHVTQEFEKL
jgi:hypothetical protein